MYSDTVNWISDKGEKITFKWYRVVTAPGNSWNFQEPPGIEFTPGKPLLEVDKLTKTSGKPLEKSYAAVCP